MDEKFVDCFSEKYWKRCVDESIVKVRGRERAWKMKLHPWINSFASQIDQNLIVKYLGTKLKITYNLSAKTQKCV